MHSEFSASAKLARSGIAVPRVPLQTIYARSRAGLVRERTHALALAGALVLALVGVGTGAASRFYDGVRVWLAGDRAAIAVDSVVVIGDPMPSELREVAARAAFPVVFPVGVPSGMRVDKVLYAPREHPTSITIGYYDANSHRRWGITLQDTAHLERDRTTMPAFARTASTAQVGRETVIALGSIVSPAQMAGLAERMRATTPQGSLKATLPMLRTFPSIGQLPHVLDRAEHYVETGRAAVFVGAPFLGYLEPLVPQHRPLLDMRVVSLTQIPSVHGAPDYVHAVHEWPRHVMIPAQGVRAVAAAFKAHKVSLTCSCAVLYEEPRNGTYRITVFAPLSEERPARFLVDARTFAVRPLGG